MKVITADNERGTNKTPSIGLSAFVRVTDHISDWAFFDSGTICASNQRGKVFSRQRLLPNTFKGDDYRTLSLFWRELKRGTNAVVIQRLHTIIPSPITSHQVVLLIVKSPGHYSAFGTLPNVDTIASN